MTCTIKSFKLKSNWKETNYKSLSRSEAWKKNRLEEIQYYISYQDKPYIDFEYKNNFFQKKLLAKDLRCRIINILDEQLRKDLNKKLDIEELLELYKEKFKVQKTKETIEKQLWKIIQSCLLEVEYNYEE